MSSGFVRRGFQGRTMLHDTADLTLDTDTAEADITVTVAGEIDLDTAGRFRDATLSALTAAPKTLCLDLAGVSFMDGPARLGGHQATSRSRRSAPRAHPSVPSSRSAPRPQRPGKGVRTR